MKYENMEFTENEKEQLNKNKEMIIAWIMENIVPKMNENSHIMCDFGGVFTSSTTYNSTTEYHFAVYSSPQDFTTLGGGRKTHGIIGYGEKFGYICESFESVFLPYQIFSVIDNWTLIKRELLKGLEEQQTTKKSIFSFEA